MAITNTTQNVSSLVINKVPSANVFKKMKDQNLINENELYLVDGSEIDKYTFTATAGQSTFTIPFEFDGSSSLTLYYNGVMMKEDDNYTIAGNVITLVDWTAEEGDYITVMGIQGAAAIDFAKDADKYMKQMEDKATEVKADLTSTATTAKNDITSTASTSKTEINTIVSTGKNDLNNLIDTLPDNWDNVINKNSANVMGANGKIIMDNSYAPSGDNDLVTMKYVSENSYKVGDTLTTARTDLGDDWLLCNGALVDNNINIYDLLSKEDYSKIQYWTQYFGKKDNYNGSTVVGSYLYSDFVQYLDGYYFYNYNNSTPCWTYNTEGPVSSNRTQIDRNSNYFILTLNTSKDILSHDGKYYGFAQRSYSLDSSVDYYYYNLMVSPKLINSTSSDISSITIPSSLGEKREWYRSLFILNNKILWAGKSIYSTTPLTSYTLTSLNNDVSYGPYQYAVYQLDNQLFAISINSTNKAELNFYNLNNNISFSYTLTDGSIFYSHSDRTQGYTYKSNGNYYFYTILDKDNKRTSYALFKLNKETNKLDFVRVFNQLNKNTTSITKDGDLKIFGDITLNNKNYVLFNSNNSSYISDNLFGISSITEAIKLPIDTVNKYPILDANNNIYINTPTCTASPIYKRYLPTISSSDSLYTYIKAK